MKILMIGNGFDLEHDLPTKYTQFLDFIIEFRNDYHMTFGSGANSTNEQCLNDDYFKNLFTDPRMDYKVSAFQSFIKDNLWIDYFIKVRASNLKNKENWIDFESEISRIVQSLDQLTKFENSNTIGLEYYQCKDVLREMLDDQSIEKSGRKAIIARLKLDLDKLICALEIYLDDYVGQQDIKWYNPDIASIHPEKVISFNYTDTFHKVYESNNRNVDILFVHGMATNNICQFRPRRREKGDTQRSRIESSIDHNNMVLGIDEYLTKERRRKETDFIEFKKYYQRIYKKTGNEYKKWLNEKEPKTVYIFGHSLDVTDGDLLREFMGCETVKTIIFYKNKKQLGQQIANLVKILGDNVVIEKVYGENPSIIFQQQSEAKLIENSSFDLIRDIEKLNHLYEIKEKESRSVLSKIDEKIANQDYGYFESQSAVVDLFDVLQRIGLGEQYEKRLHNIATMMVEDTFCKPKSLKAESWSYGEYDNSFEPADATYDFVQSINASNYLYMKAHKEETTENDIFSKYNHLLKHNVNGNDDELKNIWNDFQKAFAIDEYDTKKLWEFLQKIVLRYDRNCVKRIFSQIQKSTSDPMEIVRIKKLLYEIEVDEYMKVMAEKVW